MIIENVDEKIVVNEALLNLLESNVNSDYREIAESILSRIEESLWLSEVSKMYLSPERKTKRKWTKRHLESRKKQLLGEEYDR